MQTKKTSQESEAIASTNENNKLEHTASGASTRDDASDMGVPMLPGTGKERVGPEDALGAGPKRGDYSNRIGSANYHPHEVVKIEDAAPGEPNVQVVPQRPRTEDIGDAENIKGGVDTV